MAAVTPPQAKRTNAKKIPAFIFFWATAEKIEMNPRATPIPMAQRPTYRVRFQLITLEWYAYDPVDDEYLGYFSDDNVRRTPSLLLSSLV